MFMLINYYYTVGRRRYIDNIQASGVSGLYQELIKRIRIEVVDSDDKRLK